MKNPPFLSNHPFSPTPPFLEKYLIPTLITKFEEVNPPLPIPPCKGGGWGGRGFELCGPYVFTNVIKVYKSDCIPHLWTVDNKVSLCSCSKKIQVTWEILRRKGGGCFCKFNNKSTIRSFRVAFNSFRYFKLSEKPL